jgi:hypothetical protein
MKTYTLTEKQLIEIYDIFKFFANDKRSFEKFASQYTTNNVTEGDIEKMAESLCDKMYEGQPNLHYLSELEATKIGIRKGLSISTQEKQPEREMRDWDEVEESINAFIILHKGAENLSELIVQYLKTNTKGNYSNFSNSSKLHYTLPKQITEGKEAEG